MMQRTSRLYFRLCNRRRLISATLFIIYSLFMLEGCTTIGSTYGRQIDRAFSSKTAIDIKDEDLKCETGDRVEIIVKGGQVSRGKIIEIKKGLFISLRPELINGLIDHENESLNIEWNSITSIAILESNSKWTILLIWIDLMTTLAVPATVLAIRILYALSQLGDALPT